MDLLDFIPFKTEFAKAYHGLTGNATHTSENPEFSELKVRRYTRKASEIAEFISTKTDHWLGWMLRNHKTAVGGMTVISTEVTSFALLGMKIQVTFGLLEEKDASGQTITTLNAKAVTQIDSKGDMGESRRMIRMMLGATDFEFRRDILDDEEYYSRTLDAKGAASAFQQLFDEARLHHKKKPAGSPKATAIEFRKSAAKAPAKKQVIPLKISSKPAEPAPAAPSANGSNATEGAKPSRPKVTIITPKKSI
ncbi:hypothetical protein [Chlorobium sp. N1]|uniref:hypothetical protein n=1 Tax=Chlorobium sp. N1 TaxID=2491138 RepID=UPI00103BB2F7|nr:hypothetical protein [Chlorobium sp. N1]TCD48377.1 hypothetical protein E0L29_00340 [Chlorobium sp. N1]